MVYVNKRYSMVSVETIEAFMDHRDAIKKIKELQEVDGSGHYYMARMPSKCWREKQAVDMA